MSISSWDLKLKHNRIASLWVNHVFVSVCLCRTQGKQPGNHDCLSELVAESEIHKALANFCFIFAYLLVRLLDVESRLLYHITVAFNRVFYFISWPETANKFTACTQLLMFVALEPNQNVNALAFTRQQYRMAESYTGNVRFVSNYYNDNIRSRIDFLIVSSDFCHEWET